MLQVEDEGGGLTESCPWDQRTHHDGAYRQSDQVSIAGAEAATDDDCY